MPDRTTKNKWLGDIFHFDGRLHARLDAHLVERASQRQRIDNGGQHSHVIGRGSIHPAM